MDSSSDTENVEGQLGSSKVKLGQLFTDRRMEVKLGGWRRPPMPTMLKVSSSTQGEMAHHCCILHETWWIESYL